MSNVVYYLGAGASANAIHTVGKKLTEEFQAFCECVTLYASAENYPNGSIEFIQRIKRELPFHYSPDTLARKLLYKDMKEYEAYKRLLSFYFLLIQGDYSAPFGLRSFSPLLADNFPTNRKKLDERYDVIFAALMNEDTQNLPSNLSIISWNYDMQIELSYQSFFSHLNMEQILLKLGVYPRATDGKIASHTEANIIKLNGTAGLMYDGKNPDSGYYRIYHSNMDYKEFFSTVRSSIEEALGTKQLENADNFSLLQFAWDKDSSNVRHYNPTYAIAQNNAIKRASSIISQAKDLVVIGYSFPLYNRTVDTEVLKAIQRRCKVYIQVPDRESYENILERFLRIIPVSCRGDIKPTPILDANQFFVPEGI